MMLSPPVESTDCDSDATPRGEASSSTHGVARDNTNVQPRIPESAARVGNVAEQFRQVRLNM